MRKVLFPTKYIKTKIKKIVAIFFFLLISNISYCDTNFLKSLPEEIIIKQSPNDHINFKKNLFRAFIDGDTKKKNNIKKKYKKWYKARLSTNNSDEVNVKIRLMGDWKDHLKLPKSSLKVKVVDNNNISGFKYFRLYLPNTRNRNNEIFITTVLRHLDYPSYYTFNVNVNFNGNKYQAIMQEDASKEFLERSGIPELPIIKTDEYTFYLDKVSDEYYQNQKVKNSYVLYNQNFLKKNHSSKIVSDAINLMHSPDFKKIVYRNNFFESIMKKYAPHGMADHNRRYIYVPFSNIFIPLYYDGDVIFQNIKTDNCQLPENLEERFKKFEHEYYLLSKNKLTKKMHCVAIDIFKKYELHKTHKIMTVNSNYNLKLKFTNEFEELRKLIFSYLNINKGNIDYENDHNLDLGYSYTFFINKDYYKCYLKLKTFKIERCFKVKLDEYKKIISTSQNINKKNLSIKIANINLGNLNYRNNIETLKLKNDTDEYFLRKNKIYLLDVDQSNNSLFKINFENINSRIVVNGDLSNKSFFFSNNISNDENTLKPGNDKNYLNGCVTILSSYLEKTNFYAENFHCEDAINIVNSNGDINILKIKNSTFDAADFDFSNVRIDNVEIKNSRNDCLDLSFGNYTIKKAILHSCEDKGISLGETSNGNFDNINIFDTKLGIVVKDSSKAHVNNLYSKNIKEFCLSAYKKKQEFDGGIISYKNLYCNKNSYFDKFSKVYQQK